MSNKVLGGVIGFCVADALGVPVEFSSRARLKKHPITEMIGYGTHNQPEGTWSDDSSLTLCLIESLCDGFNIHDIASKIIKWYEESSWTPHGQVFDIGRTTLESIKRLKAGIHPVEAGGKAVFDNGNGSLMRILPLAYLLEKNRKIEITHSVIHEVSRITHAHPRTLLGCSIYIQFAIQLLRGNSLLEAYRFTQCEILDYFSNCIPYSNELFVYSRILKDNLADLEEDDILSTGYVVDTLEASLWCLLNSFNYRSAVLRAVNLGDDTDTVAAITGGLAGIYFGEEQIPKEWIDKLALKEEIYKLANKFDKFIKTHDGNFQYGDF